MLAHPPLSVQDFGSEATAADVRRYFRSARLEAEARVQLMNLAWELVGTEFAGRPVLYEMFYPGSPFAVQLRPYRAFDWARVEGLVDACLEDGLPRPGAGLTPGGG